MNLQRRVNKFTCAALLWCIACPTPGMLHPMQTTSSTSQQTALHYAAAANRPASIKKFCTSGFNINGRDAAGKTPLMHAAESHNPQAISVLLKNGADATLTDNTGETALHAIFRNAFASYHSIAKLLISHAASPNAKANNGTTPFLYFLSHTPFDIEKDKMLLATLLKNGAYVPRAHNASWHTHQKRLADIIGTDIARAVCQPNTLTNTDIRGLTHSNTSLLIENYSKRATDKHPDDTDARILSKKLETLAKSPQGTLIMYRPRKTRTSSASSTQQGHVHTRAAMLHALAWSSNKTLMEHIRALPKELLAEQDAQGRTLLHYAVLYRRHGAMRALLESCKPDIPDYDGLTPLLLAVEEKDKKLFVMLARTGASVDHRDINGETALYKMLKKGMLGSLEAFQHLLKKGANPNAQAKDGYTPLLRALEHADPMTQDHQRLIRRLVEYGAYLPNACHTFYPQRLRAMFRNVKERENMNIQSKLICQAIRYSPHITATARDEKLYEHNLGLIMRHHARRGNYALIHDLRSSFRGSRMWRKYAASITCPFVQRTGDSSLPSSNMPPTAGSDNNAPDAETGKNFHHETLCFTAFPINAAPSYQAHQISGKSAPHSTLPAHLPTPAHNNFDTTAEASSSGVDDDLLQPPQDIAPLFSSNCEQKTTLTNEHGKRPRAVFEPSADDDEKAQLWQDITPSGTYTKECDDTKPPKDPEAALDAACDFLCHNAHPISIENLNQILEEDTQL